MVDDMKRYKEIFIGIDLGGTNVRVGAVAPDGGLVASEESPIEASQGPEAGVEKSPV